MDIADDSMQPLPGMVSHQLRIKSGKEVPEEHWFNLALCFMQELAYMHCTYAIESTGHTLLYNTL